MTEKPGLDTEALRVVAILRGLTPERARGVGAALVAAGIRAVEVPLNSPRPLHSIELLAGEFSDRAVVGAGTVLTPQEAEAVAGAGGRFVVSPNFDADVVARTRQLGLVPVPGIATPSEAFAAIRAGASLLKAFPCEMIPPAAIKAWRAVLPNEVGVLAVGGIGPDNIAAYAAAGVAGFGIGSWLFTPTLSDAEIGERAAACIAAVDTAMTGRREREKP